MSGVEALAHIAVNRLVLNADYEAGVTKGITSKRGNLFTMPHKCFRAIMNNASRVAAMCDYSETDEIEATLKTVDDMIMQMEHHSEIEDAHVLPAVERSIPDMAAEWRRQHHDLEESMKDLKTRVAALREATETSDREALGSALVRSLNLFQAYNIIHMNMEETELTCKLWSAYTEDELMAIHRAIMSSMPPPIMMALLPTMVGVINFSELLDLVMGCKMALPAPAFAGVCKMIQGTVTPKRWEKLSKIAGL